MAGPLNVASKTQVRLVSVQLNIDLFSFSIRRNFVTIQVQFKTDVVSPCYTSIAPNIGDDFCLHLKAPWRQSKDILVKLFNKARMEDGFQSLHNIARFSGLYRSVQNGRNVNLSECRHLEHGIDSSKGCCIWLLEGVLLLSDFENKYISILEAYIHAHKHSRKPECGLWTRNKRVTWGKNIMHTCNTQAREKRP